MALGKCERVVANASIVFRARSDHLFVIAKLCQPQKIQGRDRARSRLCPVVIVFHSEKDAFIFAARAEIAAVLLVKKQAVLRLLQFDREFQPFDIERSFVKIEKTLNHECVIVGEALDIAAAAAIVAIEQFALFFIEICSEEFRCARCDFQVARVRRALARRGHKQKSSGRSRRR